MKRSLKDFWASRNSCNSGVHPLKKAYNVPESDADNRGNDSNEEIDKRN